MMITFMFSEPERKQGSEKGFGVQMARRYSENKLVGDNRHQSKLSGSRKAELFYSSVGVVLEWNFRRVMKTW